MTAGRVCLVAEERDASVGHQIPKNLKVDLRVTCFKVGGEYLAEQGNVPCAGRLSAGLWIAQAPEVDIVEALPPEPCGERRFREAWSATDGDGADVHNKLDVSQSQGGVERLG